MATMMHFSLLETIVVLLSPQCTLSLCDAVLAPQPSGNNSGAPQPTVYAMVG